MIAFNMDDAIEPLPDSAYFEQLLVRQGKQAPSRADSQVGVHAVTMTPMWFLPRRFLPVVIEKAAP